MEPRGLGVTGDQKGLGASGLVLENCIKGEVDEI